MSERDDSAIPSLPERPPDAHKGDFGVVSVVGGRGGLGVAQDVAGSWMIGAPALAARGALRSGCGLVRLVMPASVIGHGLAVEPCATGIGIECDDRGVVEPHVFAAGVDRALDGCGALVIGPGLGTDAGAEAAVLRAVKQDEVPVVVDADGLTVLASLPGASAEIRGRCVLTPHPGEYRRLAESLGIASDPVDPSWREQAAAELAQRLGCVVVLKGYRSVVSDGLRAWVCQRGHPCLATGGTGDVLSGVVASLVAQSVGPAWMAAIGGRTGAENLDLYDATRAAVQAHAVAGERWAQRAGASGGMRATELADELPAVIESMQR